VRCRTHKTYMMYSRTHTWRPIGDLLLDEDQPGAPRAVPWKNSSQEKRSEAERRVWCEMARADYAFLINHTRITREGAEACKKPIGLVSLIDEKRQWFKSVHDPGAVLGGARETPREHAFCNHAIQQVRSAEAPGLACRWIYL